MALVAARTDRGTRKPTNEDACCVEVAKTRFGDAVMAIVCDGVGGLVRGEVASSTVVARFASWFEGELPVLLDGMAEVDAFPFAAVRVVWGVLLSSVNEQIRAYGASIGANLGSTFTGVIACQGRFLAAHVGDCRLYQIGPREFRQVTEDQTLLAQKLASGELSPEHAATFAQKNVILQSVGTERVLRPSFYEGAFSPDDIFVVLCDGAYRRIGGERVCRCFQGIDRTSEHAMEGACERVMRESLERGESDNLTVACFSGNLVRVEPTRDTRDFCDVRTMVSRGGAA